MLQVTLLTISLLAGACNTKSEDPQPLPTDDLSVKMEDPLFRQFCLTNFDTDADGKLSRAEADAVERIILSDPEITSLQGIEQFTNLNTIACGATNITTIDLSACQHITAIKTNAFAECRQLTSIVLPPQLTSIGDSAFDACSALQSIELPATVQTIGAKAFQACSSLSAIRLPEGVQTIGEKVFNGCSALSDVTLPSTLSEISSQAFCECRSLAEINIPNGVIAINDLAFTNCPSLRTAVLPSTLQRIGEFAFGTEPVSYLLCCRAAKSPEHMADVSGRHAGKCSGREHRCLPRRGRLEPLYQHPSHRITSNTLWWIALPVIPFSKTNYFT